MREKIIGFFRERKEQWSSRHCDTCGSVMSRFDKFCDNCGAEVSGASAAVVYTPREERTERSDPRARSRKYILTTLGLVLLLSAGLAYSSYSNNIGSLSRALHLQQEQSRDLADQINEVKKQAEAVEQQNASSTRAFTTQLDSQKAETENAKRQALLAQQALAAVKKQVEETPVNNDGTFPNINSRAIVLVVCGDSSGNLQSGSGTIINSAGYILTNKHVVTDSYGNGLTCGAFMNDGSSAPRLQQEVLYLLNVSAPNAGYYSSYDAAVLAISSAVNIQTQSSVSLPTSFPFIRPQGGNLKQGDSLFIFGYPGASSFVFNVTRGIVSSFTTDNTFINTDAIIDLGNSGGAAITSDGRFVGIPTQKYVGDGDYLGQILGVENLVIPN